MKNLFAKYQKPLLRLANHKFGRKYLGINPKEKIVGITPNAFAIRDRDQIKAEFRCYPLFKNKLGMALQGYDSLLEGIKYYFEPRELIWMEFALESPATFYPTAGAGDGILINTTGGGSSWATARGAAIASAINQAASGNTQNKFFGGGQYTCDRIFSPFDTSGIGGGATVSAGVYSLASSDIQSHVGNLTIGLVGTTQVDPDVLVVADYNNLTLNTPTEFATRLEHANISEVDGTYNDWTMNANGLAAVSLSGFTKLAIRLSDDIDNSTPAEDNTFRVYSSAEAGTTKDPKLVVTFTAAAGGAFLPLL